ncbi:MAG: hypothetical protein LZF86_10016 [Nitrospira sp.]|nr:MAG: hypothetical protein LZF86_10016 [Nitrospira sp.]
MTKKSNIEKTIRDMDALLKFVPGLDAMLKSLESTSKQSEVDEEYQRIKLPYVSAEPIRGTGWTR